jgi:hypothetical protein
LKSLTNLKQTKALELNLQLLIELPFFLRLLKQKDKDMIRIWIRIIDLEDYIKLVDKLEIKYCYILKEIIEYRKLRKKYPSLDKSLRDYLVCHFHEEIKDGYLSMDQMRFIMKILQKKDKGEQI